MASDAPSCDAVSIARRYFELSNRSDLAAIRALMRENTTYSSENTGIFLGVDAIMAMQKRFHESFASLAWTVREVDETKPGVVRFVFDFAGEKLGGEKVRFSGVEHVVVHDGKIQHIEIRSV